MGYSTSFFGSGGNGFSGGNEGYNAYFFTTGTGGTPEPTYDLNVFLVGGQSNSAGRALAADGPAYISSGIVDGVSNYDYQNTVYDLSQGVLTGRDTAANGRFAFNHVAMSLASNDINDVVAVTVAVGNTILYANNFGNGSYNADYDAIPVGTRRCLQELELKYNAFVNWAESKGLTYKVQGLIWHQGESDAVSVPQAITEYGANWAALVAKVRSFVSDAQMPVFYGTIPIASADYNLTIRNAMLNYAAGDANAYCRDNNDLTLLDAYHFDAPSNIVFGEWVYNTWLAQI